MFDWVPNMPLGNFLKNLTKKTLAYNFFKRKWINFRYFFVVNGFASIMLFW